MHRTPLRSESASPSILTFEYNGNSRREIVKVRTPIDHPMALQSPGAAGASSSVSRLLSSAKLSSTKTLFSVDVVGTKRRNGLSVFRGSTPLLKSSLRSPLSAKAIPNFDASASGSDLKPKVIYPILVKVVEDMHFHLVHICLELIL